VLFVLVNSYSVIHISFRIMVFLIMLLNLQCIIIPPHTPIVHEVRIMCFTFYMAAKVN
jgi:hypothetical protein